MAKSVHYRGLLWLVRRAHKADSVVNVYGIARVAPSNKQLLASFPLQGPLKTFLRTRSLAFVESFYRFRNKPYIPADGVPWEINVIPDDAAYIAARDAFKRAQES